MAAKAKKQKATRRRCWASIATGIALAGIAIAAMRIDLLNNYDYGVKVSHELAGVMALAAIGVTALPAAAALRGWDLLLRLGTAACVALTVWAAVSAYADRQGAEILARQAGNAAYEAAQADAAAARQEIAAARTEAAAIAEQAAVGDLESAAAFHREQIAKETKDRGGCGAQCKAHERALEATLARLPAARAKEAALARVRASENRLDAAKVESKVGPGEVSMLATVIARQTGQDAAEIARAIALATTAFAIIVTIIMALMAHHAIVLILAGLAGKAEVAATTAREAVREGAGLPTSLATAASISEKPKAASASLYRRPALDPKRRMQQFVGMALDGEGEVLACEVYEHFTTWWATVCPGADIPSANALGRVITDAGIAKVKRGGKMRYAARLAVAVN
jgi:hypothetical protein